MISERGLDYGIGYAIASNPELLVAGGGLIAKIADGIGDLRVAGRLNPPASSRAEVDVDARSGSRNAGEADAFTSGQGAVATRIRQVEQLEIQDLDLDLDLDFMGESFIANGSTVTHSPTATAIGGDSPTMRNFERSTGVNGHDVIVHGELTPDGEMFFRVDGERVHTQQIADAILENPDYIPGTPIQMVVCRAACGLSDELSDALGGVPVQASPRRVRLDENGRLIEEMEN